MILGPPYGRVCWRLLRLAVSSLFSCYLDYTVLFFSLINIELFVSACCIYSDPFGALVVILFNGGIYINIDCAVMLGAWGRQRIYPVSPWH